MLPHPAAPNATDVAQSCPNRSAAGLICNNPVNPQQHHCYGCRYGGGVDRKHAAVGRPALTRAVNGQSEYARMDLVFNLNGSVTYLDVSFVAPFSCSPFLVSASTRPGYMAKRAEKSKFNRYPHIYLVPFILETTGRPGPHIRKFISYLMRDADNPPQAIRTPGQLPKCAPQCHLQTTTHSRCYVISSDHCHSQFTSSAPCCLMQVPS